MKILLIGATGNIGKVVDEELNGEVEIIRASRSSTEYKVDITSEESIKQLFENVGKIDGVICASGAAHFSTVDTLTPEQNQVAVNSKLLGQINLVLLGLDYINDEGFITLTTGILMDDPIKTAASSAMANGGVAAFVKSSAIELPRGIRINHVSPTMLKRAQDKYGGLFQGYYPATDERIGLAYRKSVFGNQTGQAYKVY